MVAVLAVSSATDVIVILEFNVVDVAFAPPRVKLPEPAKVAAADKSAAAVIEANPVAAVLFNVIAVEALPLAEATKSLASVVTAAVSAHITELPAVNSSLSKLVTIRAFLGPVAAVSPAKSTSPSLMS